MVRVVRGGIKLIKYDNSNRFAFVVNINLLRYFSIQARKEMEDQMTHGKVHIGVKHCLSQSETSSYASNADVSST